MFQISEEVGDPVHGYFAEIEIRDKTDSPGLNVETWWNWFPGGPNFNVNWKYKIDSGPWSADFTTLVFGGVAGAQKLGTIYVGYAVNFTFHINSTTDPRSPGPYEITGSLYKGSNLKSGIMRIGLENKKVIPFVKVAGVWKPAEPWIKHMGDWKTT